MIKRRAWLTPDSLPTATKCIQVAVPDDLDFFAMLVGAIAPLFDEDNFEQFGDLTPAECAEYWREWDAAQTRAECT